MDIRRIATSVAAAGLILTGCSGGPAGPTLEPRESVVAALQSVADLQTVHALLRIEVRSPGSDDTAITIEGDVDIAGRELAVTAKTEAEAFGASEMGFVIADRFVFSRTGTTPWSVSGNGIDDPLAVVPTTARIASAVEDALRDPETTISLEGTEDCGDTRCDRLRAEIPAPVAWRAVATMLEPLGQVAASSPPMPSAFPGFVIELWIEQGTHRLRQATNTTAIDRQTLSIIVALSDHDEPVDIQAPVPPTR